MATVVKVAGSFANGDQFGAVVEKALKAAGVPVTGVHVGNKVTVSSGHIAWIADGPEIVFTYQPAVAPATPKETSKQDERWIKPPAAKK